MIRRFAPYYKPHIKLFLLDITCAFLIAVCNLVYPFITKEIINIYVPQRELNMILIWGGVLLAIYIIKALLNYVLTYWGHMVGVKIQADMRRDLFQKLQRLPFTFFDKNQTGHITSRVINDLMDISEVAHHGPEDIFLSLITMIGSFIVLATINWKLSLIVFAVIPFIIIFTAKTRVNQRKAFRLMRIKTGEINAEVESSIEGIRVAKAYVQEEHELEKFQASSIRFQKARAQAYKEMGIFHSGMQFFADILYLIVLVAGGYFFYKGYIDDGEFAAYIIYIMMLINPIRTLVNTYEQIQNGMSGFVRFLEVMDMKEEPQPTKEQEKTLDGFHDCISFEDVSFTYQHEETEKDYVLSHLSFDIEKGKVIALVGPSGGGKTTICHLIPRFYEIDDGKITIDGIDIRDITTQNLRKRIGIVAQDVFLFPGSILENIAYGNEKASKEEIMDAAKKANIHEFIMALDKGYDTEVGERGVMLSGGQKQRISIARAFLKNPDILILDEATSALDNMTEMQIQNALYQLQKGRTTIVVAHRLSTVKNADEIIVLTENGIVEKGTHEELIAKNGIYAELYQYQFKE